MTAHGDSGRIQRSVLWTGIIGTGAFNLFDGIVNHKILQLHPVREGVSPSGRTISPGTPSPSP